MKSDLRTGEAEICAGAPSNVKVAFRYPWWCWLYFAGLLALVLYRPVIMKQDYFRHFGWLEYMLSTAGTFFMMLLFNGVISLLYHPGGLLRVLIFTGTFSIWAWLVYLV